MQTARPSSFLNFKRVEKTKIRSSNHWNPLPFDVRNFDILTGGLCPESGEIEVHDFVPCGAEIGHEFFSASHPVRRLPPKSGSGSSSRWIPVAIIVNK